MKQSEIVIKKGNVDSFFCSDEYKDSEQLIAWEQEAMTIDKNLNSTATFDIVPHLVQETIVQQWGPGYKHRQKSHQMHALVLYNYNLKSVELQLQFL